MKTVIVLVGALFIGMLTTESRPWASATEALSVQRAQPTKAATQMNDASAVAVQKVAPYPPQRGGRGRRGCAAAKGPEIYGGGRGS